MTNKIDTEIGRTPVVLTFDDGRLDNFEVIEEATGPEVSPNSVVGILQQFHREHPDFPLEATFFLNGKNPFKQPEWTSFKLNYLIERGMDIGNHTLKHLSLAAQNNLKREQLERQIGAQALFLEGQLTAFPKYRVNTYALCHGSRPRNKALRRFLRRGTFKGYEYQNIAILNVGSGPARSPATFRFNPFSIPRVRANEKGAGRFHLRAWIQRFEMNPLRRYVSDGKANVVTVPKRFTRRIDPTKLNGATLKILDVVDSKPNGEGAEVPPKPQTK